MFLVKKKKKEKKRKEKERKKDIYKRSILGIIVPTMNHYPRNR